MKAILIETEGTKQKRICHAEALLPFGLLVNFRYDNIIQVGTVVGSDDTEVKGNGNLVLGPVDKSILTRLESPEKRFENLTKKLIEETGKIKPIYLLVACLGMNKEVTDTICEMIDTAPEKLPMEFIKSRARCIPVEFIFSEELIKNVKNVDNPSSGVKVFETLQDCCRNRKISFSCIKGVRRENADLMERELARFGLSFQPPREKEDDL